MQNKFQSRGPSLDTDKCVANMGNNRFNMVIAAAARAKEIKRKNSHSTQFEHTHPIMTALLEIQEGKIGTDYLKRIK